jgi:hypothetical protein
MERIEETAYTFWADTFRGTTVGSLWSTPIHGTNTAASIGDGTAFAAGGTGDGLVRDAFVPLIHTVGTPPSISYLVQVYIKPYLGSIEGAFSVFFRMDDTTPDNDADGARARLTLSDGAYSGSLIVTAASATASTDAFTSADDGYADAGWFSVLVTDNSISCFWKEHTILSPTTIGAAAGQRIGFELKPNTAPPERIQIERFRIQYFRTPSETAEKEITFRRKIFASSNGLLYKEDEFMGDMVQISSSLTLASDRLLMAQPRLQQLFIADYGEGEAIDTDGALASSAFTSAATGNFVDNTNANVNDHVVGFLFDKGTERQTINIDDATSGGNFTLTIFGETTANILFSAAPSDIKTSLEALNSIAVGDITMIGIGMGPTNDWVVTFTGLLDNQDIPLIVGTNFDMTGGSSTVVTVTETIKGGHEGEVDPRSYQIDTIVTTTVNLLTTPTDETLIPFTIERAPKVYDAESDTLLIWQAHATKGFVPLGCPIIALWNDRMVLAGSHLNPQVWYMSRIGNPYDWDYSATDVARAVAGNVADAGRLGEPIRAVIPHNDDCIIFGGAETLWTMRGDPSLGGRIDALSYKIGVVDKRAWCHVPGGGLLFLSLDGLYRMPPGCGDTPTSVSREKLPIELLNIDRENADVQLAYDVARRGVHIYVTRDQKAPTEHWWFDWETDSFWLMEFADRDLEPTALLESQGLDPEDQAVILGGRDGFLRRFHESHDRDDDNNIITSFVDYGPFDIHDENDRESVLTELVGVTGNGATGADVDWAVRVGENAENAFQASTFASGNWNTIGLNLTHRPRARGGAALVRLSNGENRAWSIEKVTARIVSSGTQRLG